MTNRTLLPHRTVGACAAVALFLVACGTDGTADTADTADTSSSRSAASADAASVSSVSSSVADEPTTVSASGAEPTSPIVDTGQEHCFGNGPAIDCGSDYVGQDAEFVTNAPAYIDNGDGTVTDVNTGLMWLQDPGDKVGYDEAVAMVDDFSFAGYDDWRLPTIDELYSLAVFTGIDPSGLESSDVDGLEPFIDDVFVMTYGDESGGARLIDSQWLTSTVYGDTVMNDEACFFGFNVADGRIKCYPIEGGGSGGYFALFVRGDTDYGTNVFVDNGDGTILDEATGLTWTQADSGEPLTWESALTYCLDLELAGDDDWRLPDIKELQSIVDYTRSPDVTDSPAIDPIFDTTTITNEAGEADFPFFWSSTSHLNDVNGGSSAAYIAFGRALGNLGDAGWIDVHGAGAQRSDPKEGDVENYADGFGPQGDAVRVENFARCVSSDVTSSEGADPSTSDFFTVSTPAAPGQPEVEPDLAAAAATLGVTEAALAAALGAPPPDLAAAAATLGVTEAELVEALGVG